GNMAEYGSASQGDVKLSDPLKALANEPEEPGKTPSPEAQQEIVTALEGYRREADDARKGGLNPRDDKWKENLDLYWNRYDFSKKAPWQAREVMPEVPTFVDRFAAAMKEALVSSPESFYTVIDPADKAGDLALAIKRILDVWLSRVGRNQNGTILSFPAVFEEQVKMGALMACSSVVCWKNDVPDGRVAVEAVDPRFIWLDHTYRNLYRIRQIEMDRHELISMVDAKDGKGKPLFNLEAIAQLTRSLTETDQVQNEERTGSGTQITSARIPIILDEYYATVLKPDGTVLYDKALCVVANRRFLVRGPEVNPYWHGNDWLTFAPLVTVPLSVYGRSYMEDFGAVAKTFVELTNMILDAVHTSALRAFAVVPGMLLNPGQINEGITPNKLFLLDEGFKADDFAKALDLGTWPAEAVQVWTSIKNELREAASINEIGLGQFAPKGRTSATEIASTQESSSGIIRSVAETIETRWLDPTLDLVWKTGLQHMRSNDALIKSAAGDEMFAAIYSQRKELVKRPITLQARGISQLIQKSRTLRTVIQVIQIIGSNPLLLQEFLKVADMGKLVALILQLSDIDISKLQ
ncbi:MAG: hypothetical protein NUV72_04945, partial [Bauldia sp.]|nr:hypothetical protein [Bauldia sp.]